MLLTKFTKISHVISVCLLGVHCGKPLVAYSHVISEETAQYHYSAIVRMNCDYGHERAEGSYALRCLDNGRWNDTSLRCKRKWSSGVRYHLVKLNRLPMTSAHALLNGTETAFRQVHARKPKFAIYLKRWTSLGVRRQLLRSSACADLKRSILRGHAGSIPVDFEVDGHILHQEIIWSPW